MKNIIITIDKEHFLLQTNELSRTNKINIESACSAINEDYPETLKLSPYDKILFIVNMLKTEYQIQLEFANIELEINI